MKSLQVGDLDEWLPHGPAGAHFVSETAPEAGETAGGAGTLGTGNTP